MIKVLCMWCLCFLSIQLLAQPPTSGKGSGSGAASGAPASAAAPNQQSGYVYRLKFKYHVQYASKKSITRPIQAPTTLATGMIYSRTTEWKDTVECDTAKSAFPPQNGIIQIRGHSPCATLSFDSVSQVIGESTTCAPACSTAVKATETVLRVDSLPRYWNSSHAWFKKHRLKVSITQADSGKLQLGLYDRNYDSLTRAQKGQSIHYALIWTDNAGKDNYALPISADDSAQNFYLQIDNKQLVRQPISYLSIPYAVTQYGAMVIPYKYRWAPRGTRIRVKTPQFAADTVVSAPSESTGSINIALYLGRKWGRTKFYFDQTKTKNTISFMAAGFIGASLVPLSAANVKYPKYIDSLPAQSIAFTFGGSATLEWKFIDLGLFGGWDVAGKNTQWIYNKKFWLGFGIGVNLGMFTTGSAQFQL